MKLYLYLQANQLDVLRHARLHLTGIRDVKDPFIHNAKAIQRQAIRIAEADFQQEIEKQFKALPPALKGLMDWDTFVREAQKKRPQIEAQMRKKKQGKPSVLPNPQAYDELGWCRLFKRPDHPALWERYAQQHQGLVVELDTAYPAFQQQKQILRPVVYGSARPQADHPMKPFPALFHRAPEYASEEEVRLVRPLSDAKSSQQLKNGQTIYFYPFPPRAVMSVILGVQASPELKEQVQRILTYDMKYKPGRPLREVLLDPTQFKLHLRGTL